MSIGDSDEPAQAARALAMAFAARGETARAVAALESALRGVEDRELALHLEADLVSIAALDPETAHWAPGAWPPGQM